LCISAVWAQSDRGTITGTVSDPAGAVVSNAPIEAKHLETGAIYQAATSATGNYTRPGMQPARAHPKHRPSRRTHVSSTALIRQRLYQLTARRDLAPLTPRPVIPVSRLDTGKKVAA
jgi:hypothetical protein